MGSYGTNGNLELSKLVENLEHVGTVTKQTFPVEVTVDGKSFTINDTGLVEQSGPRISTSNLKKTTVADTETEITTTSTNKPEEGTPLEISFDVSISEGSITAVDKGTLTNGKVTYDTNGTETEVIFTFTLSGVDNSTPNTVTINLSNYYAKWQVNEPNVTGLTNKKYVTWTANTTHTEYTINDEQTNEPEDWYDYEIGQWANIKTSNNGLEAYWVWIPRFEYVVPTSETATKIDVKFIKTSKTTADSGYTIHPAFKFENKELDGIWVAKFEANSSSPSTNYGGGNDGTLKVQVKPGIQSWRELPVTKMFAVCRNMTQTGGVLASSTNIDSHMMKNTEWGAVAILSQSDYGVFNSQSANTGKVWNNPYGYNSGATILTGYAGNESDAASAWEASSAPLENTISEYNKNNGPKASTTGTVYGVYDMAGGSWEYVAGCISGHETSIFGNNLTAADISKYINSYTNSANSNMNYDGAIVGDATKETKNWNSDHSSFVTYSKKVFRRGGVYGDGTDAGIFAFYGLSSSGAYYNSFRPVFVNL